MEHHISIDGHRHLLTSDDDYLEAMGEVFEPHMVDLFKTLIKPGDVVLDVGANIGLTAILFSRLAKTVYAFEPSPTTFGILKTNLSRAVADNVQPLNLGAGEREEQLTITFATNNRSGGFVSDKIQPKLGHTTEQIAISSLDSHFAQTTEPINFLKIDVEGFEGHVIRGARGLLEKHKPIVALEMNHFCLNALRRITIPDFLDALRAVFPFLYAIDGDNSAVMDLHDETQAYQVMHQHIVKFRFPTLVGAFDPTILAKLEALTTRSQPSIEVTDARGRLEIAEVPERVQAGEAFFLDVTLSNDSQFVWRSTGDKPVRIAYHWQDTVGTSVVFDGSRTHLEIDQLSPGQTTSVTDARTGG